MTELVGILNVTPDSFSDGGRYQDPEAAVQHARQMLADGAAFIDIGAESTRPGAKPLPWMQEASRLQGIVKIASRERWPLSLDTYHPETVGWLAARLEHEFIINDVTGFRDRSMRQVASALGYKVIVSHLPEDSRTIQDAHQHKLIDSVQQVVEELSKRAAQLEATDVDRSNIILDPGIGFGKTPEVNWKLLRSGLYFPDYEVMIGYSRKSFLGRDKTEDYSNNLAGIIATRAQARYLRVHDVALHARIVERSATQVQK